MTQHWVNPVNATSDAWGYELSPRELMRKIKPNVSHTWQVFCETSGSRDRYIPAPRPKTDQRSFPHDQYGI
jgi:hypothetical protein